MATTATNSTDPTPRYRNHQIHGTNPTFLLEKVIRSRIYDSLYWKEHCFALNAETLVDRAIELDCIGGTYGGSQRPTAFLCLVLKLLQLQPEREVLMAYLEVGEFKYLRALAAFYIRLTFPSLQIYEILEPLLEDYRKLRYRNTDGSYRLTHVDDFVDELLTQERVCHVILPRLAKRRVLEEAEGLEPRVSKLEDALLAGEGEDGGEGSDQSGGEEEGGAVSKSRWKEKLRRRKAAREAREQRAAEEAAASPITSPRAGGGGDDADGEVAYASQEESGDEQEGGRYVSRSPSRSRSRSASPMDEDAQRYISRSSSPASRHGSVSSAGGDGEANGSGGGYVSKSPSRSPDRD